MKLEICWTNHAVQRQKEWNVKFGITKEEIENLLKNPHQIIKGDGETLIAQSKRDNGLLRVVYIKGNNNIRIITLYWTSKIERYLEEE